METKDSILTKEDIISTILENLENDGLVINFLKEHFYFKVKGARDPRGCDEIKILGWMPASCENCEKFQEFMPPNPHLSFTP